MSVPDSAYGVRPEPEVSWEPRCWRCGKLLAAWATIPWRIRCYRCKAVNQGGSNDEQPARGSNTAR